MSLSVYLLAKEETEKQCAFCGAMHKEHEELFNGKITHNLVIMANAAGIYNELWRPEEIGITTAGQLIVPLRKGLRKLNERPELFTPFNPHSGWGHYDCLLRFVTRYLDACIANPDASVVVSR